VCFVVNRPHLCKITHLRYMLGPSSVVKSDYRLAGRPSSPSEEQRPAYLFVSSYRVDPRPQGVSYVRSGACVGE
jgi:hypothetical protein